MTDFAIDLPQSLAAAEEKFSRFLQSNGYPPKIRWVVADSIVLGNGCHCWIADRYRDSGLAEAKRRYTEGVVKGLGITLRAVCASDTETFATVFIPADDTDAQYHLMGRCLKMSCPVTVTRASIVSNPIRWLYLELRNRERSRIWRESFEL